MLAALVGDQLVAHDAHALDALGRRGSRPARRGSAARRAGRGRRGARRRTRVTISTLSRAVRSASSLCSQAALAASSSTSAGSTITSASSARRARAAPGSCRRPAPGRGDRAPRPPRCRSSASASSAWSAMSVTASSSRVQDEHPRHVDRDVAVADHDGALGGEVELVVHRVRVAVVPGDELRGGDAAGQVLAGDPEPAIARRAVRVDDRVVVREQLVVRDVARRPRRCRGSESPRSAAVFSNTRETDLIFGWSGATPARTSPHGVGSRSNISTSTFWSLCFSSRSAA